MYCIWIALSMVLRFYSFFFCLFVCFDAQRKTSYVRCICTICLCVFPNPPLILSRISNTHESAILLRIFEHLQTIFKIILLHWIGKSFHRFPDLLFTNYFCIGFRYAISVWGCSFFFFFHLSKIGLKHLQMGICNLNIVYMRTGTIR